MQLSEEVRQRHARAFGAQATNELPSGGEYQWRRDGEFHLFNPDTVHKLQYSVRSGNYKMFKEYSAGVDGQATSTPGICRYIASKLCEWVGPS